MRGEAAPDAYSIIDHTWKAFSPVQSQYRQAGMMSLHEFCRLNHQVLPSSVHSQVIIPYGASYVASWFGTHHLDYCAARRLKENALLSYRRRHLKNGGV